MSNPGDADLTPITGTLQLAEYLAGGCKPAKDFRIGTEHEKFGYRLSDQMPPPYEPAGIRALLDGLVRFGWEPILDREQPIGLKGRAAQAGASISLEPAGQLELSGAPLADLHRTRAEFAAHFAEVAEIAAPLGLGFAPLGFHPVRAQAEMPWMPKSRYAIMRRYMPAKGQRGLDMMLRTCTVQVNLDFASEADMVRKLRVSMALQPLATAMFANSPFYQGRPNGLLSNRAQVWTDVDADRTGMLPIVFDAGFGFERYVDWLLDVPMYFIQRDGGFIDLAGASFRDFMAGRLTGRLAALSGRNRQDSVATIGDFADHVTTGFTDVRLKRFLEMRGADAGTPEMMLAQSAFWVGLLYDEAALAAADALVREAPWTDYLALRTEVPRLALSTPWRHGTLRDLTRAAVGIAQDGLRARGLGEEAYLTPLAALGEGAPTQAERWLERYETVWDGDISRIFAEAAV